MMIMIKSVVTKGGLQRFAKHCLREHRRYIQEELENPQGKSFIYKKTIFRDRSIISKQESIRYCRKIRIYPTKEQKQLFNRCIGANRYFYNKANAFVKSEYEKAKTKAQQEKQERIDKANGCIHVGEKDKQCCKKVVKDTYFCKAHQEKSGLKINYSFLKRNVIRGSILVPDSELSEVDKWQKDVPFDTRQFAIDQLIAAYSSNFALNKHRENRYFDVKYKTKKTVSEIFQINKNALNFKNLKVFIRRTKKSFQVRSRDMKKILHGTDGTVTCLKVKPGKWYLCLPRTKDIPKCIFRSRSKDFPNLLFARWNLWQTWGSVL